MTSNTENVKKSDEINYIVLIAMFAGISLFGIMNLYEPQIDTQFDFFELAFPISEFVAAAFGFRVAKKYWGSKIFGKAYLSLSIGLACAGIGSILFLTLEVITGAGNPYPAWNDFFTIVYFLFVTYHLVLCIRHFKKRFTKKDKLLIIMLPLTSAMILLGVSLVIVEIPGSVPELISEHIHIDDESFRLVPSNPLSGDYQHITVGDTTYDLVPVNLTTTNYVQEATTESIITIVPIALTNISYIGIYEPDPNDELFWPGMATSLYVFTITTLNLSLAIIGFQVFRGTILGSAWGLLLIGITLAAVGDMIYYLQAVVTYDRTYPDIAFWVFSYMIIAYALYLHRKRL